MTSKPKTWRIRDCQGTKTCADLKDKLETRLRQDELSSLKVEHITMAPFNDRFMCATVTFSGNDVPSGIKDDFAMDDDFMSLTP